MCTRRIAWGWYVPAFQRVRQFPDVLRELLARTPRSSHDPPPRLRRFSRPAGTPPADSVRQRPCQTAETICLLPLPVREPSTCARSRHTVRPIATRRGSLRLVEPAALSPVGLPLRLAITSSIFLEPFAPPALPGFIATMVPLTPAGRSGLLPSAGLSASCTEPSDHSVSNHPPSPRTLEFAFYVQAEPRTQRVTECITSVRDHRGIGLRHSLAGSPRRQAESSSLALRTGRSPPVAPHPASRRRSYVRLQDQTPTS